MADDMRYPAAVSEAVRDAFKKVADRLEQLDHWEPVMTSHDVADVLRMVAEAMENGAEK